MSNYEPRQVEAKWRRRWEEQGHHRVDLDANGRPTCYCLVMFSYPSGNKLHLGHWFNYGPTDTWARYRRMRGDHVFQPMGFDSFGLPAENYAIKMGVHPKGHTEANIAFIRDQLKAIGAMYDWRYEVQTHDPDYYQWTQWLFLELYRSGNAYRAEAPVNWCDSCQTVLANEQVVDGLCERCDGPVRRRNLTQWFFAITKFAEELLEGLDRIDWPANTGAMQRNWIGRSEGALATFPLAHEVELPPGLAAEMPIFTTRPDTLFGVTYMVLAPEHPLVEAITTPAQRPAVNGYIEAAQRLSEIERTSTTREKTGVFTGAYAINPMNHERVPIWVADYVLASYGTGAIMAVPGHDERDFEFAKRFGLEIRRVIVGPEGDPETPLDEAFVGDGAMCHSGAFDGLSGAEARDRVIAHLEASGIGERTVNYRLRDWLVSRQRYWGAPIPIVHCQACGGEVPVPVEQLPVLLPDDVEFTPTGESPLRRHPTWRHTECPECGGPAERDCDTMDTFVDSSWYYLRYLSPHLDDGPFDRRLCDRWLPVDTYVGGREHAVMHLLYARYICKVLHRLGHLDFDEPFTRLVHQGVITAEGARMSKSRGNVVNPEEYLDKYGSDTLRMYLMFGFSYVEGGDWDSSGIHGVFKYLARIHRLVVEHGEALAAARERPDTIGDDALDELLFTLHSSIKRASTDIERFQFNTAIARHMELTNALSATLQEDSATWGRQVHVVVAEWIRLLAPFAPHLGEELWERLGGSGSIFDQAWPEFDEAIIRRDQVTVVIQVNGKVRDQLEVDRGETRQALIEKAKGHGRIPGWLEDKPIRKVVVVPDRLVNFVVG